MNGHNWIKTIESGVRSTIEGVTTTKKQWLIICTRCGVASKIDYNQVIGPSTELYSIDPLELDGTIIDEPIIEACDTEIVRRITKL